VGRTKLNPDPAAIMKGKRDVLRAYVDDNKQVSADIRCIYLKEIRRHRIGPRNTIGDNTRDRTETSYPVAVLRPQVM
jgi:hypothetical protein